MGAPPPTGAGSHTITVIVRAKSEADAVFLLEKVKEELKKYGFPSGTPPESIDSSKDHQGLRYTAQQDGVEVKYTMRFGGAAAEIERRGRYKGAYQAVREAMGQKQRGMGAGVRDIQYGGNTLKFGMFGGHEDTIAPLDALDVSEPRPSQKEHGRS